MKSFPHGVLPMSTGDTNGAGLLISTVIVTYDNGKSLSTAWHSLTSGTSSSGIHKYGCEQIRKCISIGKLIHKIEIFGLFFWGWSI